MERSGWFTRIYLVVFLLGICVECSTAPEHVHLSVTGDPDEMAVMWFTEDPANSLVQYTKKNYDKKITVKGTATLITASAFASQKPGYMHLAILKNLDPATVYLYSVGSDIDGWSSQFFFKTQPTKSPSDHKIHFLAFGDMGVKWENSLRTMRTLAPLARALDIDMVLHAGDLAYAFKNMTLWDLWFDRAQAIAGYVPYMISAGNRDDPEVLRERFVYPKQPWNPNKTQLYYSFDFSWIHFVSISTVKPVESFEEYTPGSDQIRWLEEDLRQARERIDSGKTDLKWIVLYGHTPMYSSSNGHDGGNKVLKAAIESMMYTYGVNIAIWGDDHVYERSYPIYDDIPDTSTMYIDPVTKKQTFVNPDKPIHLLAGTAGIDLDGWLAPEPPVWSAFREMANGFVDIEATQSSLRIKFIRLEDGSIADEFFVTKVLTSGSTMNIGWLLIPAVGAGVLYYIRTSRSFSRRKI